MWVCRTRCSNEVILKQTSVQLARINEVLELLHKNLIYGMGYMRRYIIERTVVPDMCQSLSLWIFQNGKN